MARLATSVNKGQPGGWATYGEQKRHEPFSSGKTCHPGCNTVALFSGKHEHCAPDQTSSCANTAVLFSGSGVPITWSITQREGDIFTASSEGVCALLCSTFGSLKRLLTAGRSRNTVLVRAERPHCYRITTTLTVVRS